ncbi:hypothetical protein [Comamonas sp. UBA7840]|uniref:hypothetical protein n=1 Tax=Comamonas sp. UBA7840 TaxID=1946392 RepID=UPI0025807820|nr:hypothetical protein [Comamonas sp. UBA7840]
MCLKIQLNSSGAKKGNEISFLENEISKIKTNENYDFNDLYNDYEKIKINTENNEIIFSSKRGLLFLSAYLEKKLSGLDYVLWKRCLEDVSRYIPEGIFEDKEYEILKLEFFYYKLLDEKNDILHIDRLIRKARICFKQRINDNFDVKWAQKIEGEDVKLKISVANNFLLKYRSNPISDLSELVLRMDVIFIEEGDCYRYFKRIVDSYRTKKSKNKVGLAKFNMTIKSSNAEWLQNVSDFYGISRSDVINLIISHRKELKLESFFEERKKMMFPE